MSRVAASAMFFFKSVTTNFRGNGYSKSRLICDCIGEPFMPLQHSYLRGYLHETGSSSDRYELVPV